MERSRLEAVGKIGMRRWRFEPTVEELIGFYLKNKLLGIGCECDKIIDADVYGDDKTPWEAFGNQLPWQPFVDSFGLRHDSCSILYVFTRLRSVGKVGTKRKTRVAGIGCWSGNTCSKGQFNAENRKIGYSKSFTYETDQETQTLGHWTMMEYSINPEAHPELRGNKNCDALVLCKIKREDDKCSIGGKVVPKNDSYHDHLHLKKRPRLTPVDDGQVVVDMPIGGAGCQNHDVANLPVIIDVEDDLVDMPSGDVGCPHHDLVVDIEDEIVDDGEVVGMPNGGMVMMSQNYDVDLPVIIDIEDALVDVDDCQNHEVALVDRQGDWADFRGEDLSDPDFCFDVPDSWFNVDDFWTHTAGVG